MCLIAGIADGRLLIDRELIGEDETTIASRACGHHGHVNLIGSIGVPPSGTGISSVDPASGSTSEALANTSQAPIGGTATSPSLTLDPAAEAQVIFLGTSGGAVLSRLRKQPANALIVNGVAYLVDMGGDTIQQLVEAAIPMTAVRHAFITHYHSDHVSGWPALAILGWRQIPRQERFDIWGPSAGSMHHAMRTMLAGDIASREFVAGQKRFDEVVFGHDVHLAKGDSRITPVFSDDNVDVSAVRVYHGSFAEMPYAYAYRFDIRSGASAGKSVVFSGDTALTDNLPRLAQGCDLLIHEAIHPPAIDEALRSVDPSVRDGLREHIFSTHTSVDDIPRVAKSAGTDRVVLSHLGPASVPAADWAAAAQAASARIGYRVEVSAATDLDVVTV